jgi:hypothetical protein
MYDVSSGASLVGNTLQFRLTEALLYTTAYFPEGKVTKTGAYGVGSYKTKESCICKNIVLTV